MAFIFRTFNTIFHTFHPAIMHINKRQFLNFKPSVMKKLGRGSGVKTMYIGRVAFFVFDMLI